MRFSGVILLLLLFTGNVFSQQTEPATVKTLSPEAATNYLNVLSSKFNQIQTSIEKKGIQALQRLQKQEVKLYKQLAKKDSVAAKKLFEGQQVKYAAMQQQLQDAGTGKTTKALKEYLPHFDTLKSSLGFIEKSMGNNAALLKQLGAAKGQLQQFESKMQVANEIKRQIKERKQLLQQQLEQFGMTKQLMGLKKEVYYYQQQLGEYKAMLNDTRKLERKAIALLKESSLFKEFMKKNSLLAQLFKLPDNYGSPESLAGLQTNADIQTLLNQRTTGGGPNAQQMMRQQVSQAQNQLKALKNKINKLGGNSNSMDMPDFKPNKQKTKSFLQRLEYGLNFQTQQSKYFMPVTTDIALTAGYKLNDKSIIGVGAAYKLGWGKDINHIRLSGQGLNLRSYIDIKLKGNFWITGGYEQNYLHEFTRYEQLKDLSAWQQSGLIGLTKKYKLGKKTHQFQMLWDVLSYQQTPRAQALKFRVGYVL